MNKMSKIKWLDWSKNSFQKSKKENKPIILDIMAVWCYWCKRLEQDTYEKEQVINFVNKNFIPIRVDTDKRPDINNRYNLGGWPTTAVLNLKGELISGAMYLPPSQMIDFLEDALSRFNKNITVEKEIINEKTFENNSLEELKNKILNSIKSLYDSRFGGFGYDQKFPHHNVIEFLLTTCEKDKESKEILIKTLTSMADGDIFDKEESGFFRYSTQQDWSQPHYEKLLDDNARLLKTYSIAYKLTNINKFKETALKLISFISNNFLAKQGFFYASQDADEEYYGLSLSERRKIKPPHIDKTLFTDFNCYAINSFFTASEILKDKELEKKALKCLNFLIKNLLKSKGINNLYDKKSDNLFLLKNQLLFISSLLESNKKEYIKLAESLIKKVISNFGTKEKTFYDILDSKNNFGYLKIRKIDLEENSLAIKVLLKLFEKTKNKKYYEFANKTIKSIKLRVNPGSIFSASFAEIINRK